MLSDVPSAPRLLVDVFSFVVHGEFQVGVLFQRNFGGNLTWGGFAAACCACCSVSFVWEIARDSPIVNIVSQTMNKQISFSWIKHENAPWLSAAKCMLPGNAKCSMTRYMTLLAGTNHLTIIPRARMGSESIAKNNENKKK